MREVEFRGWDNDTKRWYYGSYVRLERTTPYPMSHTPEADAERFEAEQVDHYIFFTESMDWGLPTRKLKATVDPKSVAQYVGFRDSQGRRVYEGDIVAIDMWHGNERGYIPEDGVIKWHQASAAFKWFSLEEDPSDENNYWLSQTDERQREVIGNIYENPELLKAGDVRDN